GERLAARQRQGCREPRRRRQGQPARRAPRRSRRRPPEPAGASDYAVSARAPAPAAKARPAFRAWAQSIPSSAAGTPGTQCPETLPDAALEMLDASGRGGQAVADRAVAQRLGKVNPAD